MKTVNLRWLSCLSLFAGLMISTNAHAVWTFGQSGVSTLANCTVPSGGTHASSGTPSTCVSGSSKVDTTTVSLSGYYVTNATNNAGLSSGTTWSTAPLMSYSGGQGINSDGTSDPNHAVDNNGKTEGVLLSFSSSVALTSIGTGYTASAYCKNNTTSAITFPSTGDVCPTGTTKQTKQTDNTTGIDISVFRWVDGSTTLTGKGASTMSGWQLVGNYGDIGVDTSNPYNLVNSTGLTSSYWLISAYNSGFAPTTGITETRGGLTNGDDYFKLFAAAGTTCATTLTNGKCGGSGSSVPEPASLALTSVALLSVAGLRRRSKSKQAA
ncbi:hypothetical protein ABIC83_002182 [Roseateles asaccharophilus]